MSADEPSLCILPGCGKPRDPVFLGWHGNKGITSAYCEGHGPDIKTKYCSECGQARSPGQYVWPDGIQPAGVCDGEISTLTVTSTG